MRTKITKSSIETLPWWQDPFVASVTRPLLEAIPARRTLAEVRLTMKALHLKKGDSLLDICCGTGRHLVPLAKRGMKVTGVDICEEYLQHAERKAEKSGVRLRLVCEDARRINFHGEFSGVINMWTSVGYFEKEIDNFRVIKNAYQALRPGGGFLLQADNRDWIARNYGRKHWLEVGDYKILDEREFDFATGRINSTWTFVRNGREVAKKASFRIYCFHELREYFRKAGFGEVTVYGSTDFSPLTFDSRMLFIVGKKRR